MESAWFLQSIVITIACRLLRFLMCGLEDWRRQIVKSISWLTSPETSFFRSMVLAIFRSMGKSVFLGSKQFAFSQSSFFAVALPLIGIDRD